jgi:hypothetical protein
MKYQKKVKKRIIARDIEQTPMSKFDFLKIKLTYKKEVSKKYNIPIKDISLPDQDYYDVRDMYFFFWQGKKYIEKDKLLDRHLYDITKEIENWVFWETGEELTGEKAKEYILELNKTVYKFLESEVEKFPDLFTKKLGETKEFFIFEYLGDYKDLKHIDEITDFHFKLLQEKMKYYKENRKYNLLPSMELGNWMINKNDLKYVDMDSFIFCTHTTCFFKQIHKYEKLQREIRENIDKS